MSKPLSKSDQALDDFYIQQIANLLTMIDQDEVSIKFWENKRKELRK